MLPSLVLQTLYPKTGGWGKSLVTYIVGMSALWERLVSKTICCLASYVAYYTAKEEQQATVNKLVA